jgi:hypothetical protein
VREIWDSGVHDAEELHRRIKEIGFTRSVDMVRRQAADGAMA